MVTYIISINKPNNNMWKKCKKTLIELFFPTECFFCKKTGSFLCEDCAALLDITQSHRPERANKYLDDIYAAGNYENKYLKRIIAAFKYEPFLKSLGIPLAKLIADHFSLAQTPPDRAAVIVPVPLAGKRLRWRGYNQSQIIARELGLLWQIPVFTNTLSRRHNTKTQAELGKNERVKNVKGAFVCDTPSEIKNKVVYLLDDVVTTGATMEECAKVLKHNGAAQVIGLAIARTET